MTRALRGRRNGFLGVLLEYQRRRKDTALLVNLEQILCTLRGDFSKMSVVGKKGQNMEN